MRSIGIDLGASEMTDCGDRWNGADGDADCGLDD